MVWRHPFPGPGLAIRIIGAVDRERLDLLRAADLIAREELTAAGLDRDVWQFPVVLLADVRSVGVQGDGRTYGHPVVLRPVSSEDAMTADWSRLPYDVIARISTRITNEVRRGQPGGPGRDQQAAGHHRVGVRPRPRRRRRGVLRSAARRLARAAVAGRGPGGGRRCRVRGAARRARRRAPPASGTT